MLIPGILAAGDARSGNFAVPGALFRWRIWVTGVKLARFPGNGRDFPCCWLVTAGGPSVAVSMKSQLVQSYDER